jgi:hypothetical protein
MDLTFWLLLSVPVALFFIGYGVTWFVLSYIEQRNRADIYYDYYLRLLEEHVNTLETLSDVKREYNRLRQEKDGSKKG